jgi:hypothetical protein
MGSLLPVAPGEARGQAAGEQPEEGGGKEINKMTPEDRQRVYLEEKARLEIRQKLQRESQGKTIGCALLAILGILVILFMAGSVIEENSTTKFNALTPDQQRAETLRNCASLERGWEFKIYSELTPQERRLKASCEYYESGGK